KWSNDDYGNGTYNTSVFQDLDGSVSGVPASFILINHENNGVALDSACEVRPSWNAAVCKGDIGRLAVAAPGGSGGPSIPGFSLPGGPGGASGGPEAPPPAPVVLSRDGKTFTLSGETNVRAGTEITVATER